jgi:hypothetical protein
MVTANEATVERCLFIIVLRRRFFAGAPNDD